MGRTILITGTRRSGTREVAERIASGLGGRVIRILTAERTVDLDLTAGTPRANWRTTTAPRNLLGALPAEQRDATVLIDCLTVWAANRLVALGDPSRDDWNGEVEALTTQLVEEINRVVRRARHGRWSLVLVLNDLDADSLGAEKMSRAYRKLIGCLGDSIHDASDGVYTVVGGLPYAVKRNVRLQPV